MASFTVSSPVQHSVQLACPDFSGALSHALEMLGSSDIDLKEEQKQAIRAVYEGKDVFVWLPTGFGKSICSQTLPFLNPPAFQGRSCQLSEHCKI